MIDWIKNYFLGPQGLALFGGFCIAIAGFWSHFKKQKSTKNDKEEIILNQKKEAEEIIQNTNNNSKKISSDIKYLNYEAKNREYFQKELNNFLGYDYIFKFGYYGIHQSEEFDKPFKKAFGKIERNEYIDFSEVYVEDPYGENYARKINLVVNYQHVGNMQTTNFKENAAVFFHPYYNKKSQILLTRNYGAPKYTLYTVVITINPHPPFTYILGPVDKKDLDNMEVYKDGKLFKFRRSE